MGNDIRLYLLDVAGAGFARSRTVLITQKERRRLRNYSIIFVLLDLGAYYGVHHVEFRHFEVVTQIFV